jgi:hypothetical protein
MNPPKEQLASFPIAQTRELVDWGTIKYPKGINSEVMQSQILIPNKSRLYGDEEDLLMLRAFRTTNIISADPIKDNTLGTMGRSASHFSWVSEREEEEISWVSRNGSVEEETLIMAGGRWPGAAAVLF